MNSENKAINQQMVAESSEHSSSKTTGFKQAPNRSESAEDKKIDTTVLDEQIEKLKINNSDINRLVKDVQNAHKMVFEQVFILMIYVRTILNSHDLNLELGLIERINLIDVLFKIQEDNHITDESLPRRLLALKDLQEEVLYQIESNTGSNEIILYLKSLTSQEGDEYKQIISEKILRSMQDRRIAFPPVTSIPGKNIERKYTYYQMYTSLQDSILIFQKLLSEDAIDKQSIKERIYSQTKKSVKHLKIPNFQFDIGKEEFSKEYVDNLRELFDSKKYAEILKDYLNLSKKYILKKVRTELAIELGKWSSDIFEKITNPFYTEQKSIYSGIGSSNDNKTIEIKKIEKKLSITSNYKAVKNLYELNQLDVYIDSLKTTLGSYFSSEGGFRPYRIKQTKNNENSLAELSAWYERYSTGYIKSVDQIPKVIVSIIEFDLNLQSPGLNGALENAEKLKEAYDFKDIKEVDKKERRQSPIKEKNLLVTYIITSNLFLSPFYINSNDSRLYESFLNRVKRDEAKNLTNLHTLNNKMMQTWTIFERKENDCSQIYLDASFDEKERNRMMYRFKKLPSFFDKNNLDAFREINSIISLQSSSSDSRPFPYASDFPWPLWIRKY